MKRRNVVLVTGGIVLATLVFVLSFEKNPKTPYHPTDGMDMAIQHDRELYDREGVLSVFPDVPRGTTFADTVGFSTAPTSSPFLGLAIVHYVPSRYPGFVRQIGSWLGFRIRPAEIDRQFVAVGGYIRSYGDPGGTSFSTPNDGSEKRIDEFRKSLSKLEPNGELRLHTSYLLVQHGKEVRVYPLDKLPKNVQEFYKFSSELRRRQSSFQRH